MVKTIENYKEIDAANVAQFNETGRVGRYDGDDLYTCVICGKKNCIDSSYSTRGHNLICSGHLFLLMGAEYKELSEFVWGENHIFS